MLLTLLTVCLRRRGLATKWDTLSEIVTIAMVGKYTELADAYLSVIKALQHAAMASNRKLDICWIEAAALEDETKVRITG